MTNEEFKAFQDKYELSHEQMLKLIYKRVNTIRILEMAQGNSCAFFVI
jgi:hypothetical protein